MKSKNKCAGKWCSQEAKPGKLYCNPCDVYHVLFDEPEDNDQELFQPGIFEDDEKRRVLPPV